MLQSISELLKNNESQNLEFKTTFGRETIETIAALQYQQLLRFLFG